VGLQHVKLLHNGNVSSSVHPGAPQSQYLLITLGQPRVLLQRLLLLVLAAAMLLLWLFQIVSHEAHLDALLEATAVGVIKELEAVYRLQGQTQNA
jgi:hypothetical protein